MIRFRRVAGFAVIADDLTKAADSGVQLIRTGYQPAAFFRSEPVDTENWGTVVSRAPRPVRRK